MIAIEGELVTSAASEESLHLTPAFARTYGDTIGMTQLLAVRLERVAPTWRASGRGWSRSPAGTRSR